MPRRPSTISSAQSQGNEKAISWSCVWPKIRSPEQGRITCGIPVCIVVTMMSAQTARPSNDEASRPPRRHSAACVSRMTCAGLAYTHTTCGSNVARSSGATSSVSYSPGANLSMAASERCPASLVSVYMPSQRVPTL